MGMTDAVALSSASLHMIRIAAAVISDSAGRLLLVRKRGTSAFMQAGGKIEPGEAPEAALRRELAEELGLAVRADELVYLGRHSAPAANEPGHVVEAALFALEREEEVIAGAEIEELIWLDADQLEAIPLAPLTRDHVLALHRERCAHG